MKLLALLLCVSLVQLSKIPPNPRIIGGFETTINTVPWQVSLEYTRDIPKTSKSSCFKHFCGGSIISEKYILTAAHCTEDPDLTKYKVRVGSNFCDEGGKVLDVKQIINHPEFNNDTFDYDIAILELGENLSFNENVSPVFLPRKDVNLMSTEYWALASGWGDLGGGPGLLSKNLMAVKLRILQPKICKLMNWTPRMLCASFEKVPGDACQGDSGGPLTVDNVLLGVTSHGAGCAAAEPGFFTNVGNLRDFITNHTGL